MPKQHLDVWELRDLLQKEVAKAGGQKQWAATASVTQQYVSAVLGDRQEPGPAILRALGLKRKVTYTRDAWDKEPEEQ